MVGYGIKDKAAVVAEFARDRINDLLSRPSLDSTSRHRETVKSETPKDDHATVQLMVEFYDPDFYEWNIGNGPRLGEFYEDLLLETPGSVIEFGCGTGDVLLRLAHQGRTTCGIDFSERMLALCRQKALDLPERTPTPRLIQGNIKDVNADRAYDIAVLANDLVAHFLDRKSLSASLNRAKEWTSPGARVLIDIPRIDPLMIAECCGSEADVFRNRGCTSFKDDQTVLISEQSRYDKDTRVVTVLFRYEHLNRDRNVVRTHYRTLHHHPWNADEIALALEACGFVDVKVSDFDIAPSTPRFLIEGCRRR